jgi:uncharacterized protein
MAGAFELKKAANGQFMFNLKAGNGEIILTSETYSAKDAAEGGIASVRKNAATDANFERKTAKDGSPYFHLKSGANGQILGRSEMYSAPAAVEMGIASVKANDAKVKVKVKEV